MNPVQSMEQSSDWDSLEKEAATSLMDPVTSMERRSDWDDVEKWAATDGVEAGAESSVTDPVI